MTFNDNAFENQIVSQNNLNSAANAVQQAVKRLLACGLVLAAWLWVLPAAAGGLDAGEDALASSGALSASGAWADGVDIDLGSNNADVIINAAGVDNDVATGSASGSIGGGNSDIGQAVSGVWLGQVVVNAVNAK